jgi:hypothetical protein
MQATYQLAKETAYRLEPFGPRMTLAQAQRYQSDLTKAGFTVLVVNMESF